MKLIARLLGIVVAVGIGAGLISGNVCARESTDHQRFSLAISGGASKGAYEAGFNWALLKLARESEVMESLAGGQFRRMELASVAGASAGGVNSILSSLTWCSLPEAEGGIKSRIDDNLFRDSWLIMDINGLLPPQPNSEIYLPGDAVFSRRDYLAAADDLLQNWRKSAYRRGCRVPLGVTVTRVEPLELVVADIEVKNQRFYIPFELRVQEDGTVAFSFDPKDYPRLSDPAMILMPHPRDAPEFSIPDESVIEAAVVTSAFPTAFGRRRIQYCRLQLLSAATSSEHSPGNEELDSDLVCPDDYELDEAEFADGGLFDNLPVGLARTLAELNSRAFEHPLPVSYFYIDPDRVRYQTPDPPDNRACVSENPPDACRTMDFSLFSEARLLVGALGTARKYELYRETTSKNWQLNLSQLAYELAQVIEDKNADLDCDKELPFFDKPVTCAEAVRRAGNLLEIVYDRVIPEIISPYSAERLVEAGLAHNCQRSSQDSERRTKCKIDIDEYRNYLVGALLSIVEHGNIDDEKIPERIEQAGQSIHSDRVLRVTNRGAPITGTLLGDFGSFLDYKFRDYDYYVGVYDAIVFATQNLCSLQYNPELQSNEFGQCTNRMARAFYDAAGVGDDPRGRYIFARIAEQEFASEGLFKFSYSPFPPVDLDMQIIHDGLAKALEAGAESDSENKDFFAIEDSFFEYLKAESFTPTRTEDGAEPLLTQIIADRDTWGTEMTRRVSARLVYLERDARNIYEAREPDPDLRESSYTSLMGLTAHALQSATYKYPAFTFSPSTAPESWIWRYIMPYELGFDLAEGDALFTWQPTMALSPRNLLNVRASLGFEAGLLRSSDVDLRENYLGLGVGYIRRTGSAGISSYGFTPTWYHTWSKPTVGDQDTFGGDIFVAFLKDRLRVGLGSRDFNDTSNHWFLTLSVTDLPGLTYWLTR
jgi:predicted acylesterase/phospholipase RssA